MNRDRTLALAALGAAPWLLVVRGPYQYDDVVTPVHDPASQSIAAWITHFGHTLRPLAKLTFAIEASAGLSGAPWARRVVSIVILAVSAWLFARWLARLGARAEIAVALAWVWAAHPIQAECVLALAGRPMLLAAAFSFAALRAATGQRGALAGVFLACAVLSRETAVAVALPAGLLLSFRGRSIRSLEHVAAVVIATVAWLLVQPRYRELADYSMHGRPWLASVVAQVAAIPIGQSLYVRPWALTVDHGEAIPPVAFWLGLASYVVAAIVAIHAWRTRRRPLAAGASLWIAALAPTQSIVPKLDPLTERPLPLALAALFAALVALRPLRRGVRRGRERTVVFGLSIVAIAASAATYQRGALYASEEELWRDAASKSVVNARPFYNLAKVLEEQGRVEEALDVARVAARIDPYDSRIATLVDVLRVQLPSPR